MVSILKNISDFLGFTPGIPQIAQETSKQVATVNKSFSVSDPAGASLLAFGYAQNNTGQAVSSYSALSSSPVYACVKLISESIAKLPIEITGPNFQKKKSHPIARLLRNPNPNQNYVEFMQYIVANYQLTGNAVIYIERNRAGEPTMLVPIASGCAEWNWSTIGGRAFYNIYHPLIADGGIKTLVSSDDIIHIKNFSIDYGYSGVSPIYAGTNIIGISLAQNKTVAQYYSKSAISTIHVTVDADGEEAPEALASVAASFKQRFQGSDNANDVIITRSGINVEPLALPAADSQLLASRQFSVEEIARIFSVPLSKLSVAGDKAAANYEQDNLAFTQDCLMSVCTKIEEAFEDKLLFAEERESFEIKFDFDEVNRTDTKTRTDGYQIALLNGWLSVNEVREQEGLPPINEPWANTYRVPANTVDPTNQEPIKPQAQVSPTGGTNSDNI